MIAQRRITLGSIKSIFTIVRFKKYHCNTMVNSVNNAYILRENFVNFGEVTPEFTKLMCELLVRHAKNWRIISQDIQDKFSQSFYHMKVLWVQMIDLDFV